MRISTYVGIPHNKEKWYSTHTLSEAIPLLAIAASPLYMDTYHFTHALSSVWSLALAEEDESAR
jgi:hypothetical protein